MSVGDYAKIETSRRGAWKRARHALLRSSEEHAAAEQRFRDLEQDRATYLRDLLAKLPFRWHVEHAYTPRETGSYGGADHIVVDEPVRVGRVTREPDDALSRPLRKFWGLSKVFEEDRMPSSQADIEVAERLVDREPTRPKTSRRLDAEIAESLADHARKKT